MSNKIHKTPKNRFWFIIVLLVLLAIFASLLFIRSKNIEKFKPHLKNLNRDVRFDKVDSCISKLYLAENYSRLYSLSKRPTYLSFYKDKLYEVKKLVQEIQIDFGTDSINTAHINILIDKKIKFSTIIFKLNNYTDSLLSIASVIQRFNVYEELPELKSYQKFEIKPKITIDSIIETKNTITPQAFKNESFFKRLSKAIKNKNVENRTTDSSNKKFLIRKQISLDTTIEFKNYNLSQLNKINSYYLDYFKLKNKHDQKEAELLLLNNQIFEEFKLSLMELNRQILKNSENNTNKLKSELSIYIDEYGLNATGLISIIALLSFIIVINLRRLYFDEKNIINYSNKVQEYSKHNKEFLANMSHELRTPLNSIIGFTEQLNKLILDNTSTEYISAIYSSSKILLEIVNDILDFSSLELDKVILLKQPFSAQKLINELVSSIKIQAEQKNLILKTELDFVKFDYIIGDAFRLKQVILNLLSNAIKYTKNGSVTLKAQILDQGNNKSILKIQVSDTGIGIEAKYLEVIFDKFAQVNSIEFTEWQTGTGLGLAITKRIVGLFKGSIRVESQKGIGSTFFVEIPVETCESLTFKNTHQSESESFQKTDFNNVKILLVDDNEMNIKLAGVLLKKWQIYYDVAYNGSEALALFENNHYDLILTDIQMPVMDGISLTKTIRNSKDFHKSETPIVGITANVLESDIAEYLSAGMNDILLKPYTEQEYLYKIYQFKQSLT